MKKITSLIFLMIVFSIIKAEPTPTPFIETTSILGFYSSIYYNYIPTPVTAPAGQSLTWGFKLAFNNEKTTRYISVKRSNYSQPFVNLSYTSDNVNVSDFSFDNQNVNFVAQVYDDNAYILVSEVSAFTWNSLYNHYDIFYNTDATPGLTPVVDRFGDIYLTPASMTPTGTKTPIPTLTKTVTRTPTRTMTGTKTPILPTKTNTPRDTITVTWSPTNTATISPTNTPWTPTLTATISQTWTVSPTFTAISTETPVASPALIFLAAKGPDVTLQWPRFEDNTSNVDWPGTTINVTYVLTYDGFQDILTNTDNLSIGEPRFVYQVKNLKVGSTYTFQVTIYNNYIKYTTNTVTYLVTNAIGDIAAIESPVAVQPVPGVNFPITYAQASGTPVFQQIVGGNLPQVVAQPYGYSMVEKDILGHTAVARASYNSNVGTSYEDIWDGSSTYVFPVTAQQMAVVSTSGYDRETYGSGIQIVDIGYLDNTYAQQNITVALNGTNPVLTTPTNIYRINHFAAYSVGISKTAIGTIKVQGIATPSITYAQISSGENRHHSSIYTVPLGFTFYLSKFSISETGQKITRSRVFATYDNVQQRTLDFFVGYNEFLSYNNSQIEEFNFPLALPAGTDIKVSSIADSAGAEVSARMEGWLE